MRTVDGVIVSDIGDLAVGSVVALTVVGTLTNLPAANLRDMLVFDGGDFFINGPKSGLRLKSWRSRFTVFAMNKTIRIRGAL